MDSKIELTVTTEPVPERSSTQSITYILNPAYRKFVYQGSPKWDEIVDKNQVSYVPKDELLSLERIIIRKSDGFPSALTMTICECYSDLSRALNQLVMLQHYSFHSTSNDFSHKFSWESAPPIILPGKKDGLVSKNLTLHLNRLPEADVILNLVFNEIKTLIPHFEAIIPRLKNHLYSFGYKEETGMRETVFDGIEINPKCSLQFGSFKEIETRSTKRTKAIFSQYRQQIDVCQSIVKDASSSVKKIITKHEEARFTARDYFSEDTETYDHMNIWFDTTEHAHIFHTKLRVLTNAASCRDSFLRSSVIEHDEVCIKIVGLPAIIQASNLLLNDTMLRKIIEDHVNTSRQPIILYHVSAPASLFSCASDETDENSKLEQQDNLMLDLTTSTIASPVLVNPQQSGYENLRKFSLLTAATQISTDKIEFTDEDVLALLIGDDEDPEDVIEAAAVIRSLNH